MSGPQKNIIRNTVITTPNVVKEDEKDFLDSVDDSEFESDTESNTSERNDEPYPDEVTEGLEKNLIELKRSLYNKIIFGSTTDAQNPALLEKYLCKLNRLYRYANDAQRGIIVSSLKHFPKEIRNSIKLTLELIATLVKENDVSVTILISDCVTRKLKEQPFVQGNKFDELPPV